MEYKFWNVYAVAIVLCSVLFIGCQPAEDTEIKDGVPEGLTTDCDSFEDLGTLPDKVGGEPRLEQIHREAPIWDNWLMLLMLVSVYVTDIGMRRLTGLS